VRRDDGATRAPDGVAAAVGRLLVGGLRAQLEGPTLLSTNSDHVRTHSFHTAGG
jgi:hypothetical protein